MADPEEFPRPPVLTPEEIARRNRRSVALAIVLGVLVILFYLVTLVKTGPAILNRPL
jgi:hypothetical protein